MNNNNASPSTRVPFLYKFSSHNFSYGPGHDQEFDHDGSWLCGEGEYLSRVQSACSIDPGLRQPDKRNRQVTLGMCPTRARVIDVDAGTGTCSSADFTDASALTRFLKCAPATPIAPKRRICILEGLNQSFITAVGSHYDLDPSFFKDHERCLTYTMQHDFTSDFPVLPSVSRARTSFVLKYFEALHFEPGVPNWLGVNCADTGRHIGPQHFRDDILQEAILRRKCSFWWQDGPHGFEAVVLCDPPVKRVYVGRDRGGGPEPQVKFADVIATPFQGGYRDFLPRNSVSSHPWQGPPRTCMLDDLAFYLNTYSVLYKADNNPKWVAMFIQKVDVAHSYEMTCYLRRLYSAISWTILDRRQRSKNDDLESGKISQAEDQYAGPVFREEDLDWIEQQWIDIRHLALRIAQYIEDLECNMSGLGFALVETVAQAKHNWEDCAIDFQYVHLRLKNVQKLVNGLAHSMLGTASMAGNRMLQSQANLARDDALRSRGDTQRSLQEARRAKVFTVVGLIFIPLAWTCSLFSMSQQYLPGSDLFYVYFAVSLPLVVVVTLATVLFELGYGPDSNWSSRELRFRLKAIWKAWGEVQKPPAASY